MTPAHPLAESRQMFLRAASALERCRAEFQARGEVDLALKMERSLAYAGESVRILDGLIAATSGEKANG